MKYQFLILGLFLVSSFFESHLVFAVNSKTETKAVDVMKKNVATQESIVELSGKTFRKIQYEKEIYYLEVLESGGANEAYRLMCLRGNDEKLPTQIKAKAKLTERSQFVVEGLRQYCAETQDGRREVALDLRIIGGVELSLDKPDKELTKKESFFKNKKLIITPVDGLVFKADW
jgi:hypothetical protein